MSWLRIVHETIYRYKTPVRFGPHRLVLRPREGHDVRVEEMILRFIADHYGAAGLLYLPTNVAKEILKRPADFIQAAKNYCEPELKF